MIEDEVRRALHEHTAGVDGRRPGWTDVEHRADRIMGLRRRRIALGALSAAAAIALVVAAVAVLGDDGKKVRTVAPAQTTTTEATTTTSAPTTTTTSAPTTTTVPPIPDPEAAGGIYPDKAEYQRSGVAKYGDPVKTALAFARDYLGMKAPVAGTATAAPGGGKRVNVRPNSRAGLVTVIDVAQVGGDKGPWTVTGAHADTIRVDEPDNGEVVTSPTTLAGSAHAYEGHVNVEVRDGGMRAGRSLGETFVTGGGDERRPFEGSVSFRKASKKYGAIVFYDSSAEDGSTLAATVVRIAFR